MRSTLDRIRRLPLLLPLLAMVACGDTRPPTEPAMAAPLSASIVGPGEVEQKSIYEWHAIAGGGERDYAYAWTVRRWGSSTLLPAGSLSSLRLTVSPGDGGLELSVTVVSGADSVVSRKTVRVLDPAGGGAVR